MDEIKAIVIKVTYRNPEHDWCVSRLQNSNTKEVFTATGSMLGIDNEEVMVYGEWVEDKKYGKQFKVHTAHRILPTNLTGLQNYLANSEDIKGVGIVRARKLAEFFGHNLFAYLSQPEQLELCPGISTELAQRISTSWKQDNYVRTLAISLSKLGISPRWAGRILKQWDIGTAIDRISKNVYSLTEIDGIGFATADEWALANGGQLNSAERISAACVYVVEAAVRDGNVFLHEHQLIDAVVKLIVPRGKNTDKVQEQAAAAIKQAVANKELILEEVSDGISTLNLLYRPNLYEAEKGLAERIMELNQQEHKIPKNLDKVLEEVQENQHVKFTQKQMEAIRGAFCNHTLVITGGPGTGKTTCVRAICEASERLHKRASLVAPTGRAAKRLSEVTGRDASTIHRLLGWGQDGPKLGRGNRIEADILITDESSMLDLEVAYRLFEAIPGECSVVFIGDVDQLPAVGAGTVLRDIISSHSVPVITLDTIFRQAEQSLIVRNAHLIRRGDTPRFPESKDVKEDSYVMWIPKKDGKDDADWLKDKLARLVSKNIPEKYKIGFKPIEPIRDIQVLTPMKKNSLGAHELNKVLQDALNPNGEEFAVGGKVFRVGDRVMQMRNNYDPEMEIFNGDIGFIISNESEDKCVAIDFDNKRVQYPYNELSDIQLAYAQTIHKAQGSEYPVVVVVMAFQHWPMLERNLLYTANTRAKNLCLFLASKGAIEQATKNSPVHNRNTFLSQRLRYKNA